MRRRLRSCREARKLPLRNTLLPISWPKSERRPRRGGRGRLRGGRHRGVPMEGGMELDHVTFATITWARTDEEDRALRTSLGVLSGLGRPIMVADGGSTPGFRAFLGGVPNIAVADCDRSGVVGQV